MDVLKFVIDRKTFDSLPPKWQQRQEELFVIIDMEFPDGRQHNNIWEKVWRGFVAFVDTHKDDCDWFGKIDSDAWVGVENLRALLRYHNASQQHYLGHAIFDRWKKGENAVYNTGSGWTSSRAAFLAARQRLGSVSLWRLWRLWLVCECFCLPLQEY